MTRFRWLVLAFVILLSSKCGSGADSVKDALDVASAEVSDAQEIRWDQHDSSDIEDSLGASDSADEPETTEDIVEGDLAGDATVECADLPDASKELPVAPESVVLDPWGGLPALHVKDGTGRFTTGVLGQRAFVVTPEGNAFLSLGLQAVGFGNLDSAALGYSPGTLAQIAAAAGIDGSDEEVIEQQILEMLQRYGFNTVGGWSGGFLNKATGNIPYTQSLGFSGGVQSEARTVPVPSVSAGGFPDVFHPAFAANCLEYAQSAISESMASDPWCVGVYSDNEQRWHGDKFLLPASDYTLTDDFLDEGPDSPGKQALVAWFRARYGDDIDAFNSLYGQQLTSFDQLLDVTDLPLSSAVPRQMEDRLEFVGEIAQAYYRGVHDALATVAPDLLFLCDRIASVASLPVWRAAGLYCDVLSLNDYYTRHDALVDWGMGGPSEDRWEAAVLAAFEASGSPKPLWVTEWGLRADDSGLPNTFGAGFVDGTQQDRAEYYGHFTRWFLERCANGIHYATGWHWFMYMDEPPTGRFDGEDGNYGVVSIRSEPYVFLLEAMKAVHQRLLSFAATGVLPTLLLPPETVQASIDETGTATVSWGSVPLAQAYRLWVLHHPAGTTRHRLLSVDTQETTLSVPLSPLGQGSFWFGVEPLSDSLLTLGARVSNVVSNTGATPWTPSLDEVLSCDTLSPVRYHNELLTPNTLWGQSYALEAPGLSDGSSRAMRLDFVPSSLGWLRKTEPQPAEVTVEMVLPELISGASLRFDLLSNYVRPTNSGVKPASRFLALRFLDDSGVMLSSHSMDLASVQPEVVASVEFPMPQGTVRTVQWVLDLNQSGLPMEQRFSVTLDGMEILSGEAPARDLID